MLCKRLLHTFFSPRDHDLLARMLKAFNTIVSSFGKPAPAKLAAENLILGLFIYKDRSASPAAILFLSLVSASMQSGPKAPTQTFVSWRPSDTDICQLEACVGLRLSLVFDSFAAPGNSCRSCVLVALSPLALLYFCGLSSCRFWLSLLA